MKTMKQIMGLWVVVLLSLFCFSCIDDEDTRRNQNWSDGKTLVLNLNAPATQIISPMTKAAQTDTLLVDLNVLIYKDGELVDGHYYTQANASDLISALQKGQEKQLDIELEQNAAGDVYAIGNYGKDIYNKIDELGDDQNKFRTSEALELATFPINGKQPELYMYAKGGAFNVANPTQNKISMPLERIYALVTVKIKKNLKQPDGENLFDIEPISVQIKNIPAQGQFASRTEDLPGNLIGANGVGSIDGEMVSRANENDKNFLEKDHNVAYPFFIYENRQPDGSSLNNNLDEKTKTPYGLPADEIISVIKQNKTCTYIEVQGKYIRNGNPGGIGSGTITYRFFLGKDIYTNFDIERNAHYQVTLTLNGKGGADEATWRVETKLIGEIQAPDVYVGYRAGSKTRMYVTGDVADVKNVSITTSYTPTGGKEGFTVSPTLLTDEEERKYAEIMVDYTNVHSYDKKIGTVTFTLGKDGVTKTQTAKVYQVPRLVDPIAIYKRADNDEATTITVKEFDKNAYPTHGGYITLASKGSWTATIESTNAGDWFELYTLKDGVKNPNNLADGINKSITGEGDVTFIYDPKTKNSNKDGDAGVINGARFGKIVVKYHNEWCQHEIFVRQGYQPTILGDNNYAWSSFNCLGKKSNDDSEGPVTTYPTQTGWLFNGGINIAMHPFKPGYRKGYDDKGQQIEYSDGSFGKFFLPFLTYWNITAWQTRQTENESLAVPKQGPCPTGYVVATAWTYRKMSNRDVSEIYTGYIHDDSSEHGLSRGWNYETLSEDGEARLEDNNMNCNPAKGSLFVSTTDKCTNVFFNYGKGVLDLIKKVDERLIPEVGVGHRFTEDHTSGDYRFGHLTYTSMESGPSSHAYGAYYWSGSPFSGSHLGKVDLSYDIFTPYPALIDEPGKDVDNIPGHKAEGISAEVHGSFLRCVRANFYQKTFYARGQFLDKKGNPLIRQTDFDSHDKKFNGAVAEFTSEGVPKHSGPYNYNSSIKDDAMDYLTIESSDGYLKVSIKDFSDENVIKRLKAEKYW